MDPTQLETPPNALVAVPVRPPVEVPAPLEVLAEGFEEGSEPGGESVAEPPPRSELRRRFEELRAACRHAVEAGRLDAALDLADRALESAEGLGDERLVDLARCNRAAVAIALGRFGDDFTDLRRILMRNHCAETSFAAAYQLSHAYELRKDFKKGLFYARVARDRAQAADDREVLTKSINQVGVCLLGDSYFEQAIVEFERALELLGPPSVDERGGADAEEDHAQGVVRVSLIANRAYCQLVLDGAGFDRARSDRERHRGRGRRRDRSDNRSDDRSSGAFGDLFRCLRWYRRHGAELYAVWPHLFLSYGYLERGRLVRAWRHAARALDLAETHGDEAAVKYALFLLAEVEKAGGDLDAAMDFFERMRSRFYPDSSLPAAVTAVGMANVVNLRA